jgi:preprotein translocase subunit SecG
MCAKPKKNNQNPLTIREESGTLAKLMLNQILSYIQLSLAILLVGSILLQARGSGLGAVFGGEGNVYRTKRGLEKRLFQATIIFAVLFFGVALTHAILS